MQSLQDELKTKTEKFLHVFMFAQEAYVFTEYFHNPKTQEEFDVVYKSIHSREFSTIMHLMFRAVVVEVAKLYSRSQNDKFSIKRFIDSLSQTGRYANCGISQSHIDSWNNRLDESRPLVDNILLLRDKSYAHTDNPMLDYDQVDISFKQIKVLLDLAEEIVKQLYKDVQGASLMTEPVTFDRERFLILSLLAKAEKERQADILKKWRD